MFRTFYRGSHGAGLPATLGVVSLFIISSGMVGFGFYPVPVQPEKMCAKRTTLPSLLDLRVLLAHISLLGRFHDARADDARGRRSFNLMVTNVLNVYAFRTSPASNRSYSEEPR